MSVIFNENRILRQEKGADVELVVNGDAFYARYETVDGYTVGDDMDLGQCCYANLENGAVVSTGTPIAKTPSVGFHRHGKAYHCDRLGSNQLQGGAPDER